MDLLRWMGWMFARFVAVSVAILSAWIFIVNLVEMPYEAWVLIWVLGSGLAGAVGGVLYLLSIDGPTRFRSKRYRIWGWVAMLLAVMLPTSLTIMLVPLVVFLIPTLFMTPVRAKGEHDEPVTSS